MDLNDLRMGEGGGALGDLLYRIEEAGLSLELSEDGQRVRVKPVSRITPDLELALRRNKWKIAAVLEENARLRQRGLDAF